ncbi:MAG TPA: hypothetical protein PKC39_07705 [Ferruginibacter sp.]|nr:hypothetical protein [Ferruginibacter sp.]
MKKKSGKIIGFAFGILLALVVIALLLLLRPEEDFAGITIFTLLLSGLFFYLLVHYFNPILLIRKP